MMDKEQFELTSQKLWEHYQHACKKHPFFADSIIMPLCIEGNAKANVEYNKRVCELWEQLACTRKNAIAKSPSVSNVLIAEIYEIYAATAKRDFHRAHEEILDAMAVLLRFNENLEELLQSQMSKRETINHDNRPAPSIQ